MTKAKPKARKPKRNAELTLATRWEVKVEGNKRSIQLFDAAGNKIDGCKARWAGDFYCSGNQLTTLNHSTITFSATVAAKISLRIFASKLRRKYVFADGILSKFIARKSVGASTVLKVLIIGKREPSFVLKLGDKFAHGETIKAAKESLRYKISDRDTSKFKAWKTSDVRPIGDLIEAYRAITGACESGTRGFCEQQGKLPKMMSIADAIKLTSVRYGSDVFAQFFSSKLGGAA